MSIIKGTNQIVAGFGGTKRSIGEVYFSQSALATDNSGALPLFTGETIASANTIYPEFYNWILAHTELQATAEEYESALSTYGECPKYVLSDGSLRLPKLANYVKMANTTEGITQSEAGLPNITGKLVADTYTDIADSSTGVFKSADTIDSSAIGSGHSQVGKSISFDASRSSSVYGASDTVTPAHTTLYPWVVAYTAAIPASTAQVAEFQQGLSGKADTNLGNLSAAGKGLASGLGMPSDRYIDLTFGASGTEYIAPANGWYYVHKQSTSSNQYIKLENLNNVLSSQGESSTSNGWNFAFIPTKKDDTVRLTYSAGGEGLLRFIYAEGEE